MNEPAAVRFRALIVEDATADVELVRRELRRGGWAFDDRVVETRDDFLKALADHEPDVILCDFALQAFDGMTALRLARERAPLVPFIVVTGSMSQETAVECMKAGAWDYVLKDRPGRLGPAVGGALERARLLRDRASAEEARQLADERLRDAMEAAHLTCWEWDLASGHVSWVGRIDEALGGDTSGVVEDGSALRGLLPEEDLAALIDERGPASASRATFSKEVRATWPDGAVHWLDIRGAYVYDAAGRATRVRGLTMDVTARKLAEEALRASEEKYRLLVESSNEAIVVAQDGVVRFANRRTSEISRYSLAQLQGMRVDTLVHAEDRERVLERNRERQSGTAAPDPFAFRLVTGHGEIRWMELTGVRVEWDGRPATLSFLADMTERRQAEEEARRLAAAVEQAAEVVVITDTTGAIVYANPAFERVTGYTRAEALGCNPRILQSGRHPQEFYRELWETLRRGESWTGHFVNRRKDGVLFEEDATISPVRDQSGAIAYFVAVKRDVTHELALRQQLEHAQKMEAVGRLAGGVAHDFNNVLQAMLSHVSLLRVLVKDERPLASVDELGELVRRGATLTRQLLLFSRRETAKLEKLDLGEVVRDAMGMLRRLVRANVRFELDLAERPLPIEADRGQIDQVLMNLVVNASDAMPGGGLVVVSTAAEEEQVVLRVADNGPGVPEELRSRIYEPFFTTKSIGAGTGLGLAVVHGIVAQHGGSIEVLETRGGGATFAVRLPRAGFGEVAPLRDLASIAIDVPAGRGERVLVVEDEEGARMALVQILEALGYESVAAASGEEALGLLSGPPYELVLSDLMLPGISGPELVRSLAERWQHLRVILMSGYTEDEVVRRDIRRGHWRFLQKPFDSATLAREVRAALDAPPARDPRADDSGTP